MIKIGWNDYCSGKYRPGETTTARFITSCFNSYCLVIYFEQLVEFGIKCNVRVKIKREIFMHIVSRQRAFVTANSQLPIADCGLPIADCRLPIADCRLPTADCRLPIRILSLRPHAKKFKARSDLDWHRCFDVADPGDTWRCYAAHRVWFIDN